jgi:tetratricopeptide (TPR) repeat protein
MKFRTILFVVFFFFFYTQCLYQVHAQSTHNLSPAALVLAKARDLFSTGNYTAANALILSRYSELDASTNLSQSEKSEIGLMKLVSGIVSRETFAVKEGRAMMELTDDRWVSVKLAYHLGHYYFSLSMYDEAAAILEKTEPVYLNNEENERVQYEKGVSYFSLNKFDNARPFFRSIVQIEQSSYKPDAQYYLGFIDFSERKYGDAAKWFREIEKHPFYSKAVPFYLAYISNENGNITQAIQYGEAYLKSGDGIHLKEMRQLLASLYFNKEEYTKATLSYEYLLANGLTLNPSQRFELGSSYYHTKKYSKAIEQLKPLSAGNDKLSHESMYLLAFCYLQINDKSNSRSAFQYVLGTKVDKSRESTSRYYFSKLSMELGYEDLGLQGLTKFLQENPESSYAGECSEILISYYGKTNNYRQALLLMERLPSSSASVRNIAPRIYFGRALELMNDVQYDLADQMFMKLSTFKNSSFYLPSLFWRGEISFRKQEYDNCIRLLTEFVKSPVKSIGEASLENAWYNLGYSLFEKEEYENAGVWFEKIYTAAPSADPELKLEAKLRAADCAFMSKKVDKARNLYTSVLNSNGFGSDYASFQIAIIEGIKSPSSKINMLRSTEKKYPNSPYIPLIASELADSYMAEEEFEMAIPYLLRIPSLVEKDDELIPESILKLGIAYYNIDKFEQSSAQFQRLLKEYPASEQAAEAIENAKSLYVETGKIDEYDDFLKSSGIRMDQLQKDSLSFQYIQKIQAEGLSSQNLQTLDQYINTFPNGLFIAEVLNFKAEYLQQSEKWLEAAQTYEILASKGVSKYQEKALRQSGRIYYFELKDYSSSLRIFRQLSSSASKSEIILEAIRGEVRSHFNLKSWVEGREIALRLLETPGVNNDDLAFAHMVIGYSSMTTKEYASAITSFATVVQLNRSALGAEARHQLANASLGNGDLVAAEKYAIESIENSGSYEYWITRSYILLGDISVAQKDFFNAKATYKSVIDNCNIRELKEEALAKFKNAEQLEKGGNNE